MYVEINILSNVKRNWNWNAETKFFSKSIYGEDIIDTIIWVKFETKK